VGKSDNSRIDGPSDGACDSFVLAFGEVDGASDGPLVGCLDCLGVVVTGCEVGCSVGY
jgi:hypothetical protein